MAVVVYMYIHDHAEVRISSVAKVNVIVDITLIN